MRVLAIEHVGGISTFQGKWRELTRYPDVDLTVLVPETWYENSRLVRAAPNAGGYHMVTGRVAWRGYENRGFFVSGLARAIRSTRPDIIHLMEEPYSLFALQTVELSRRLAPQARIFFSSAANVARGFRYYQRPGFVYGWIERRVHRRTVCAVSPCRDTRSLLHSRGYDRPIQFIPLGIDPDHHRPSPEARKARPAEYAGFVIGYFGRLLHWKGISTLASALTRLEGEWTLLVVGHGPEERTLLEASAAGGWANRLIRRPPVAHADVPAQMNQVDAVVLPSVSTGRDAEQFGRVLVEGMACGTPVVGSTCGSIPDVIGDAGLVVPEADPEALAAAFRCLRGDAALRRHLAELGLRRVSTYFTWERVAQRFHSLYHQIMDGRIIDEVEPAWVRSEPGA